MPTDVSAPLPDLNLRDQSILTVDSGDAAAIITRIVVHLSQDLPAAAIKQLPPVLANVPVGR